MALGVPLDPLSLSIFFCKMGKAVTPSGHWEFKLSAESLGRGMGSTKHRAYRAHRRTSLDVSQYYCCYYCLTSASWVVSHYGPQNELLP